MPDTSAYPHSRIFQATDGTDDLEVECHRHGLVLTTHNDRLADLTAAVHDRCLPNHGWVQA